MQYNPMLNSLFICISGLSRILGSHYTMMVGFYSYIADITTEKERTVRIGIIGLVHSVGFPFGMAFSGLLIRYLNHFFASFSFGV